MLQINDGHDFGIELAQEWVHYLELLLRGKKQQLADPYADIRNYHVRSFSQSRPDLCQDDSLFILDEMPKEIMHSSNGDKDLLPKSLFVMALGGADTTFYKRLDHEQMLSFASEFYAADVVEVFVRHKVADLIPRGFAAKKNASGMSITNVESMIMQAYAAGIRHVAIIANAKTFLPIEEYLATRFGSIDDLTILVVAQPLLPQMQFYRQTHELVISAENGGSPGGHGHGFKYCFLNDAVQNLIRQHDLHFFIFANGDNSVVFNWGGQHYVKAIRKMQRLKKDPANANLRIGFFLVWEYLRKGGFCFLLQDKDSGKIMPQIFEAELARKSGADINQLISSKGGYNTNVAIGMMQDVHNHLKSLPMALKEKKQTDFISYSLEASLATAMTTFQSSDGASHFDKKSSMHILGPKIATYQHWNHIALRKRDDLFAFRSSLYKIIKLHTAYGDYPVICTERDAREKYPALDGNWVNASLLNTKEFFEIFADSFFDIDKFYGTLCIDLLQADEEPRGRLAFRGTITLRGDEKATLYISVPPGEFWIIQNQQFIIDQKATPASSSIIIQRWDEKRRTYK